MNYKHDSAAFKPDILDISTPQPESCSILQATAAQQFSCNSIDISPHASSMSIDTSAMREILNARQMEKTIIRIAHQIIEKNESHVYPSLILLGIPRSGVFLAHRLAQYIQSYSELQPEVGVLDITMYRDDLHYGSHRAVQASHIPAQGIDDACVILVDDVLFTGRSVRSALDAMRDIGRPSQVQLAVLVDRGHRELPIRADYVGKNLPTSRKEKVEVFFTEDSGQDGIYLSYPPNDV